MKGLKVIPKFHEGKGLNLSFIFTSAERVKYNTNFFHGKERVKFIVIVQSRKFEIISLGAKGLKVIPKF